MTDTPSSEVILRNVRLSFPAIYSPQKFESEDGSVRETYKANFLIPADDPHGNIKKIRAAAEHAKVKKWGAEPTNWPKLKADRVCLRDGDQEEWEGYAGHKYLSASSPGDRPPAVVTNRKDKDGRWIVAVPGQPNSPYAGCYVNAVVRIWVQDNKYGKRLNASIEAIQFLRDGPAFGSGPVDPNSKFTDEDVWDVADISGDGEDSEDMI